MNLPKIRENLLVQELSDEVLIYDKTTNKSYCLNETAKIVFNACDGKKTFADVNLPEDVVYLTLSELKRNNLIEDYQINYFGNLSRRDVIRKVGLASMVALPVITGLTAPKAANAASTVCPSTGGGNGLAGSRCFCFDNVGVGNACGRGTTGIPCQAGCRCVATACTSFCEGICQT